MISDKLSNEEIKSKTLELYSKLPQLKMVRKMECVRWDESTHRWLIEYQPYSYPEIMSIRDEIIALNYKFFGYIASKKYVNNRYAVYEDKLQSVLANFCACWWWYKWKGDYSHGGYRQDLAFSVFFKPRITEMLEREFDEVKYSVRRSLCIEVAEQLVPKKHWSKVTIEDLSDPNVKLSPDKMNSLKAIFGSLYVTDISEHEEYMAGDSRWTSKFDDELDDLYDSWEDLLIRTMVSEERDLTDSDLQQLVETHNIGQIVVERNPEAYPEFSTLTEDDFANIGFLALKDALPRAKDQLYQELTYNLSLKNTFNE